MTWGIFAPATVNKKIYEIKKKFLIKTESHDIFDLSQTCNKT
jgi:hypothetical protein